jgi:hypothetical protein
MSRVTEIAPDVYRISVFFPEINLQFNHFLVSRTKNLFCSTLVCAACSLTCVKVSRRCSTPKLRWISWSHFESDECGALNEWLAIAPHAQPACGMVGALVSVNGFFQREARTLTPQEPLFTGKYRFRYYNTPQLPHGWDAGALFEETGRTLFCSDLFHHDGEVEPLSHSSILDRVRHALTAYQSARSPTMFLTRQTLPAYSRGSPRCNPKLWQSCMVPASLLTAARPCSIYRLS